MIGKKGVMVLAKLGTHFFTIKVAQATKKNLIILLHQCIDINSDKIRQLH